MPNFSYKQDNNITYGYVGGSVRKNWKVDITQSALEDPAKTQMRFDLNQGGDIRNKSAEVGTVFSVFGYSETKTGFVDLSLAGTTAGTASVQYLSRYDPLIGAPGNYTTRFTDTFTIYDSVDMQTSSQNFYQSPGVGSYWSGGMQYRTDFDLYNVHHANNQNLNGYKMQLVLSEDQTYSSSDIVLDNINYGDLVDENNGNYSYDAFGNLPEGLAKGTYYVGLIHDSTNQFSERVTSNDKVNIATITVGNPTTGDSDFNEDGYDDILFFNDSTNKVGQIEMKDEAWSSLGRAGTGWEAVTTGIFDGDDQSADILWFNQSTGRVGRFDMDEGDARWSSIGKASSGWEVVEAGDFNGDGVDDILWYNASKSKIGQYEMSETGRATWDSLGRLGSGWEVAGTGDFNKDGIDDILFQNSNGAIGQFRMSSDGSTEWKSLGKIGSSWDIAGTGDFNGNGIDDILVFNDAAGKLGYFDMYSSSKNWVPVGDTGDGWDVAGVGDFNNDSRADVLWRHDDGRMGAYEMRDYDEYDWNAIGRAGADWDIVL